MSWFGSKSSPTTLDDKEPEIMKLTEEAEAIVAQVGLVFERFKSNYPEESGETHAILTRTAVQTMNDAAEDIVTDGR